MSTLHPLSEGDAKPTTPSQAWSLSLIPKHSVLPVPVLPNVWAICALTEGSPYLTLTGKLLTRLCHKVGSRTERDESFGAWGCGRVLGHGSLPAAIFFLPQCGLFAAAMVIHILALKSFWELPIAMRMKSKHCPVGDRTINSVTHPISHTSWRTVLLLFILLQPQ